MVRTLNFFLSCVVFLLCLHSAAGQQDGVLTPGQQKEFLGRRSSGMVMGTFADWGGLLHMMGPVSIDTDDEKVAATGLRSLYPEWYMPTWGEMFRHIARQTGSSFEYEAKSNSFLFNPPAMPLPYTIKIAEGWKAVDRGLHVSYIPGSSPAAMEIYLMGEFSAEKGGDIKEILKKARKDAALVLARNVKKDITAEEMKKAKAASYDALFFTCPENSGSVWRQWVFAADSQIFAIFSSIRPEQEKDLLPAVEEMVRSFKTGKTGSEDPAKLVEDAYRAFHDGMASEDEKTRQEAFDSIMPDEESMKALFGEDAGILWPRMKEYLAELRKNTLELQKEICDHGKIKQITVRDIRTPSETRGNEDIFEYLPKDIPLFRISVEKETGSSGLSVYAVINGKVKHFRGLRGMVKHILEKKAEEKTNE